VIAGSLRASAPDRIKFRKQRTHKARCVGVDADIRSLSAI
jgi:hypothetical protein